ncbi:transmembrane protein 43 homolog isoform X2 [Eriocheir sinensis]|uniref:transmembrane protein 43 homolog isoform X2 n=1 Tax=Eriocheir sinensis TaxID=95602 RepID=UPI0021C69720|nr:transmembrane protein 43 homolog isoform X2 [Eriocheir sinensis]
MYRARASTENQGTGDRDRDRGGGERAERGERGGRGGSPPPHHPHHHHHHPRRAVREQVKESIPAVVVGVLLLLVGSALLFWNEGRAVQTAQSLDEGYSSIQRVISANMVHEENNNKLVHVWGPLSTWPVLADEAYGVEINAVKLKRRVQMFQWIEEESSIRSEDTPGMPSDTSYSYSYAWRDKVVDSTAFSIPWGHDNPKTIPVESTIRVAETVSVGGYRLSPALKEEFFDFTSFSGDEQPEQGDVKLHGGMYYLTRDIYNPDIGDLRIQFYFAGRAGEMVSVVGQQRGDTLYPFPTLAGRELLIVRQGKLSVEEMFSLEHATNRGLTWGLRMAGWFLLFLGLSCLSHIVHSLVSTSPLLRDVIALGLGSANLTLSMTTSLIIVGGAWAVYRPGLALLILIVAALPFIRAAAKHSPRTAAGGLGGRRANGYRRAP